MEAAFIAGLYLGCALGICVGLGLERFRAWNSRRDPAMVIKVRWERIG